MTRAATTPQSGDAGRDTASSSCGADLYALGLAAAISLATGAGTAFAEPNRHVLRQITSITVGDVETPEMRSQNGQRVAFVATGDVLGIGTGTANKQIYMWEEDLDTGNASILQVTNGVGCDSYDPARPTDGVFSGSRPEIIAFVSDCDLDPSVDNSDGNPEIFFWEIDSGIFHQVTDTPAGELVNRLPANSRFLHRKLDVIRVKGKHEPVEIYQILGQRDAEPGEKEWLELHAAALETYAKGDFAAAVSLFEQARAAHQGGDKSCDLLLDRLEHLQANPPSDWEGIWTFETK